MIVRYTGPGKHYEKKEPLSVGATMEMTRRRFMSLRDRFEIVEVVEDEGVGTEDEVIEGEDTEDEEEEEEEEDEDDEVVEEDEVVVEEGEEDEVVVEDEDEDDIDLSQLRVGDAIKAVREMETVDELQRVSDKRKGVAVAVEKRLAEVEEGDD